MAEMSLLETGLTPLEFWGHLIFGNKDIQLVKVSFPYVLPSF